MSYFGYPPWVEMWGLAVLIFAICKVISLRGVAAPWPKKLLYCLTWPGLDALAFCLGESPAKPKVGEWLFATVKLLLGLAVVAIVAPRIPKPEVRAWVGMIGIVFVLHFGLFHLLSCFWRFNGVVAKPLMNWPVLSTSLADFWGNRWNTAFRDLTHRFLFRPLAVRCGPKWSLVLVFVFSGIVHDVVISVPAGGGYGWPTLYFCLQAVGLMLERLWPRVRGRVWTALVVLGPAFVLFHAPFLERVVLPFLDWLANPTSTGAGF